MKINEGFELRTVCSENVIIAYGRKNIDFSKVISLNESAALMWRAVLGKDFTADDMAEALMQEYEVDRETAQKDAEAMLQQWLEVGLIE